MIHPFRKKKLNNFLSSPTKQTITWINTDKHRSPTFKVVLEKYWE